MVPLASRDCESWPASRAVALAFGDEGRVRRVARHAELNHDSAALGAIAALGEAARIVKRPYERTREIDDELKNWLSCATILARRSSCTETVLLVQDVVTSCEV